MRRTGTAYTIRNPKSAIRNGVTLIELLITITIIATLSAAFLGASRAAMEHARAARTKSTIAKIHTLLMEQLASYTTRRADIHPQIELALRDKDDFPGPWSSQALADARLLATRELMKLEMPDRWSDVLGDAIPDSSPQTASIPNNYPVVLQQRPALSLAYLRRFQATRPIAQGAKTAGEILRENQGAECLYMTIILATGDGEARTLFSEQDIGDVDDDGAPEFLDGWGRPIHFLRWPAGFALESQIMSADADADHDPFDHFRRDSPGTTEPSKNRYPSSLRFHVGEIRSRNSLATPISAFRLLPLIYSAGSDGITDINASPGLVTLLDPYAIDPNTGDFEFGVPQDDQSNPDGDANWIDNIHNHLQEGR